MEIESAPCKSPSCRLFYAFSLCRTIDLHKNALDLLAFEWCGPPCTISIDIFVHISPFSCQCDLFALGDEYVLLILARV